jgi:hypothetical protein
MSSTAARVEWPVLATGGEGRGPDSRQRDRSALVSHYNRLTLTSVRGWLRPRSWWRRRLHPAAGPEAGHVALTGPRLLVHSL